MLARIFAALVLVGALAAPSVAQSPRTNKTTYLMVYMVWYSSYKGGPALTLTPIPEGYEVCKEIAKAVREREGWTSTSGMGYGPDHISTSCISR